MIGEEKVSVAITLRSPYKMSGLWTTFYFGSIEKKAGASFVAHHLNENQSNNSGQSQTTQRNPLSNQNLEQLPKARQTCASKSRFGFTSDWFKKVARVF